MPPRVSVVIPTHYRNERLRAAVASVRAQTHPAVEVLVVDDSGEAHAAGTVADIGAGVGERVDDGDGGRARDGSDDIAERRWVGRGDDDGFCLRYLPLPENRGGNPARAVGIQGATGDYVHLLDDDDRLHPGRLSVGVASLRASDAAAGYCGFVFENGDERRPDPDAAGDVLSRALAFDLSPCVTSTLLVDAALLRRCLPLADRPGADDLGLLVELARRTTFDRVDRVLVTRGVAADSRGKSAGVVAGRRAIIEEYADLYDAFPVARRRAVADTARLAGEQALADGDGLDAVRSFAAALRAAPSTARLVALLGALGGPRGYDATQHLVVRLQ